MEKTVAFAGAGEEEFEPDDGPELVAFVIGGGGGAVFDLPPQPLMPNNNANKATKESFVRYKIISR